MMRGNGGTALRTRTPHALPPFQRLSDAAYIDPAMVRIAERRGGVCIT